MAASGAELAERSPTQALVAQVRSEAFLQQIAQVLPASITPQAFVRVTVTAINDNPEVATHPPSLFQAAMKAATDGLLPDGREAAFVMFKKDGQKQVVYMPMLGGFRKIAAKHGINITADVVREGDSFSWRRFPPALEHTPELEASKRGVVVAAYATATDRDWRFVTAPIVMNVDEIEKVRSVSRAKDSGPWKDWWERMATKTVARRLFHELPLGDLEENERAIVEQADVDSALPTVAITAEEADVAARLSGALPPDDAGPDDSLGAPAGDPGASPGDAGEPEPGWLAAELGFEEALERLNTLDRDTDWVGAAIKTYGKPIADFTVAELEASAKEMRQVADTLEPPTQKEET